MDRKKLYGRWYVWEEFIGFPMILYYWIKGENIKKMLSKKIERAKHKADQVILTEKIKSESQIEYEELDNFFSNHFKRINEFNSHNFQETINYCLEQYKKESSKILTSSNLMKLQGNFLVGAEKTLFLYFILHRKIKPNFMSIFSSEDNYNKFISVMKQNNYFNKNNKFDIAIIFFSGVLVFLRKNGVIKNVKNTDIIKYLKDDFNFEISQPSFSNGIPHPTKDDEKKLFDDLSEKFEITY